MKPWQYNKGGNNVYKLGVILYIHTICWVRGGVVG
jgi:hypothetical protein